MQYVDRSARDSISIRPSRHRDFRRQWRREPIRRQRTSVSARGCHPCLRDDLLPMSPGRTFEYLVARDRYGLKPRVTRLSSPSIALENRRRNEISSFSYPVRCLGLRPAPSPRRRQVRQPRRPAPSARPQQQSTVFCLLQPDCQRAGEMRRRDAPSRETANYDLVKS